MKFGRIREFLNTLTKEDCMKVVVLIDGYNDVVDELYEIEEVREWTKELFNRLPHIIYFLEQEISQCHRIMMLNISKIEATVYYGEVRKPISEYSTEEMLKGLPRTNIYTTINNRLLGRITRKTLDFGFSIGDLEGAITAMTNTQKLFSQEDAT